MKNQPLNNKLDAQKKNFEQLYYHNINALYNYGAMLCKDKGIIEDCIQDLFADIWERRATLHKIDNPRSYLLGGLRRKVLRKIYANKEDLLEEQDQTPYFEVSWFEDALDLEGLNEKNMQRLKEAFPKLSEKQKEVIYLRFYNELNFKEIASIMNIQVRSLYKTARRAINILRSQILNPTSLLQLLLIYFF